MTDDLEERGFEVRRVAPDRAGVVSADRLLAAATPGTVLVSLMLANNEIGTLQPVQEVSAELRRRGALLHTDAAQAAGKSGAQFTGGSGEGSTKQRPTSLHAALAAQRQS